MDEKAIEEIRMQQETLAADASTPLHLIRKKELEISGRVLAAKRNADGIVTEARKQAADIIAEAEESGGKGAGERELAIRSDAEAESERLRVEAAAEAATLSARIDSRRDEAVRLVLDVVTSL